MPEDVIQKKPRRMPRSSGACDFCRRRKLGCDNGQPKCENCREHGIACGYTQRPKPERPSNTRIVKLEAENDRLRESLKRLELRVNSQATRGEDPIVSLEIPSVEPANLSNRDSSSAPGDTPDESEPDSLYRNLTTSPSNGWNIAYRCPVAAKAALFHGPSSTMFEEERQPHRHMSAPIVSGDDVNAKNRLLANTTRQRQLELVNFKSGCLEFDGVDPELDMELLAIFWNRQHHLGSIVYRPVFMQDMARDGPYFSKMLLNAMLFSASKYSPNPAARVDPNDPTTTGYFFLNRFEDLLHKDGDMFRKRHMTTIQALLIVADGLFSWCDERSLCWHYTGIAINTLLDLGIHSGGPNLQKSSHLQAEDLEIQRRVFWAAYVIDKLQSIYQGRPARLKEADNSVPIKFLDDYEELEQFNGLTFGHTPKDLGPTYSVSSLEQLCRLSVLMDRIISKFYSEQTWKMDPATLGRERNSLHGQLKQWRKELPNHLVINLNDPSRSNLLPHTLSLISMYNSLVILLHRPFVSDGHLKSSSSTTASDAFSACATAAIEIDRILRVYKEHFSIKTPPYFVSYSTYVSATIHVRIAAQKPAGSDAHKRLRHCLEVLSMHRVRCHSPRRTMHVLLGLIKRLKVDVGDVTRLAALDCEQIEGQAVEGTASSPSKAVSSLDSVNGSSVSLDWTQTNDFHMDIDVLMTDIDMAEVMRSFDVGANVEFSQLYSGQAEAGGTLRASQTGGGDNMFAPYLDSLGPEPNLAPEVDWQFFGDLLYGFDAPIRD